MLFRQPNRTFSCSRVLLFPCSPLRTMVKNVVKTRTPKMQMWSPKIGQTIRTAIAAASRKTTEKSKCGQPESSRPKYVVSKNLNRMVKPCGHKPLRAGEQTPISRAFLLPPVSYCNSCEGLCQALFAVCLLLVGRTRRA